MRCPRCGAYMTLGGKVHDPVGTRVEVEAHAWVMDDTVKCWACGYEYKPTRKPSDRPKLKMNPTPLSLARPPTASDLYAQIYGMRAKPYQIRAKARRLDEGL